MIWLAGFGLLTYWIVVLFNFLGSIISFLECRSDRRSTALQNICLAVFYAIFNAALMLVGIFFTIKLGQHWSF